MTHAVVFGRSLAATAKPRSAVFYEAISGSPFRLLICINDRTSGLGGFVLYVRFCLWQRLSSDRGTERLEKCAREKTRMLIER